MARGQIFNWQAEKTFLDKILSREENMRLRELFSKDEPSRAEILELASIVSGIEAKLLNFSPDERYVNLVHFTWVNEWVTHLESHFDLKKMFDAHPNAIVRQRYEKNHRLMVFLAKSSFRFLIFAMHTSMSLSKTGFGDLTNAKFEIQYGNHGTTPVEAKA
jgi:hypothetical protein